MAGRKKKWWGLGENELGFIGLLVVVVVLWGLQRFGVWSDAIQTVVRYYSGWIQNPVRTFCGEFISTWGGVQTAGFGLFGVLLAWIALAATSRRSRVGDYVHLGFWGLVSFVLLSRQPFSLVFMMLVARWAGWSPSFAFMIGRAIWIVSIGFFSAGRLRWALDSRLAWWGGFIAAVVGAGVMVVASTFTTIVRHDIVLLLSALAHHSVLAVFLGVWVVRARRLSRIKPGACETCGYDLHGLRDAGVCPECGSAVVRRG